MSGLFEQGMALFENLDSQIGTAFQSWNAYSTILAITILSFIFYNVLNPDEPDTHPMLLLRQSSPSLVRQPGESAVYRSHEVPHGYPLKTGLGVRPPGSPVYSAGKDGDLRDIWRRVSGENPWEVKAIAGEPARKSEFGKIITVFGRDKVDEVKLAAMGKEIAVIGEAARKAGAKRIAVYLPNSVELLTALFAGAYYGHDIVLIPYNQPHDHIIQQLKSTSSVCLIAEAGSLPLADVTKQVQSLKQVIWVVEQTSRHMDWTEVPSEVGGKLDVQQWHELVADSSSSGELPTDGEPGKVVTLSYQDKSNDYAITEFTQKNLVAAIGALISSLTPSQRLNPSDLFLPADSLTDIYTLCWTMAALFSHATLALNSVAGPTASITDAAKTVAPTVIVASAAAAAQLHADTAKTAAGALKKVAHASASAALQAGRMPVDSFLTRLNAPGRAAIGTAPGKLRLLLLSEKTGAALPALSGGVLSDLRVYTGARVVYALTSPKVAGAVAQTSIFDYRTGKAGEKYGCFGAPLSSVEVKLKDSGRWKTKQGDSNPEGEIVVSGPAVAGEEVALGVAGTFREDHTLAYIDTGNGKPDL